MIPTKDIKGSPGPEILLPTIFWSPHGLAVSPRVQNRGIGRRLVGHVLDEARAEGKKAVRLDILGTNRQAEALYRSAGFSFVAARKMYYPDTGWTEYKMFELNL